MLQLIQSDERRRMVRVRNTEAERTLSESIIIKEVDILI